MADATPEDDRRAHPRTDVELPARVVAGGDVVGAHSVNLSEGGVLLAGADFPSAGQVRIEIELAEMGWHSLDAEVVRLDDRPGGTLAARFAEAATEGGRDAIRAFFAARVLPSGGSPPASAPRSGLDVDEPARRPVGVAPGGSPPAALVAPRSPAPLDDRLARAGLGDAPGADPVGALAGHHDHARLGAAVDEGVGHAGRLGDPRADDAGKMGHRAPPRRRTAQVASAGRAPRLSVAAGPAAPPVPRPSPAPEGGCEMSG